VHEEDIDQLKRRIGMKNEEMKYCIIGFIFFYKHGGTKNYSC